jgi:hypothetical protein
MEEVVAPVLQTYEEAPEAERFAVCPGQTEEPFTATEGNGTTVTVEAEEVLQPLSV